MTAVFVFTRLLNSSTSVALIAEPLRRRRHVEDLVRIVRLGIDHVAGRGEADPARAVEEIRAADADALAIFPGHDLGDAGLDFRRLPGGQFLVQKMVALKKMVVIEQIKELLLALDEDGKFRARNEQLVADVQHGAAEIVRAHDQLRGRFELRRDPGEDVAAAHDVFLFFRRRIIREQDAGVDFAEQILRFADVRAARIFLDERGQRGARFGQSAFRL